MPTTQTKTYGIIGRLLLWIKAKAICYKVPLLTCGIVGILTHMFAFTNKLVNHDEIYHMFGKGATLSSGRWVLDIISAIFPDFSMPWIYGILSILFIAIASCVIVKIFAIKSKVLQGLLAGLIIAFPSLTGTFTYMFTASSYALAFLFSVLAVEFFVRDRVSAKIIALVFAVLSLGIYQSYIAITASLLLLFAMQKLLQEDGVPHKIFKDCIFYLIFLGVSLCLYYGITQLLLILYQVDFNSYASGSLSNQISIFERIDLAYETFWDILFEGSYGLIPSEFSRNVHIVCIALVLINVLVVWWKKKLLTKLLLLITVVLLPLGVNCMFLFSAPSGIHTLVLYGFVAIYVWIAIIADHQIANAGKCKIKMQWIVREIAAIAMTIVMICNIYIGNEVYLCQHLRYENAYAFYSSLITQVKMTPGYNEGTKLALIGNTENLVHPHDEFGELRNIAGAYGFSVWEFSKYEFITRYIGLDIPFATAEETEVIEQTAEFAEMAEYPYYGSIQKINDCIVVKFSELE